MMLTQSPAGSQEGPLAPLSCAQLPTQPPWLLWVSWPHFPVTCRQLPQALPLLASEKQKAREEWAVSFQE